MPVDQKSSIWNQQLTFCSICFVSCLLLISNNWSNTYVVILDLNISSFPAKHNVLQSHKIITTFKNINNIQTTSSFFQWSQEFHWCVFIYQFKYCLWCHSINQQNSLILFFFFWKVESIIEHFLSHHSTRHIRSGCLHH